MRTRTLFLTSILTLTALVSVLPQSASASIPPPCERINCNNIHVPCTQMADYAWDPLHQPTTVSCYIPACDRCVCQWVSAGPEVGAAGQSLTESTYVGCGVGFTATFTPGPVDTEAPICVSVHADGSPTVEKILTALLLQPICANTDCTFPALGISGVIGDAINLAEGIATIWCLAAKDGAGVVREAAVATCDAAMVFLTGNTCLD